MGARTDRRHAQGDESRQRILDAAIEIAALRGYEGTSIAQISERSGLPVSSIYWHFASKDDLIAAVIERSYNSWLTATAKIAMAVPGASLRDGFIERMRSHAVGLLKNPEFIRLGLMLALEEHPSETSARELFLEIRERSQAVMRGGIEELVRDVTGASNPHLARRVVRLIMASADGLFIAHIVDPSLDLGSEFELVAEACLIIIERNQAKPGVRSKQRHR